MSLILCNFPTVKGSEYDDQKTLQSKQHVNIRKSLSPFQSTVKEGKLFSPEQSVGYLLNVINQVNSGDTGKIFAWDGQEIQP